MILDVLTKLGINNSLFVDVYVVLSILIGVFLVMVLSAFKGVAVPILKAKYTKNDLCFADLGSLEIQLINYPRGAESIDIEHKGEKRNWPIPPEIQRILPNGVKFICISRSCGSAFNINVLGKELNTIRAMLSPKAQASVIDYRAKQLSDKFATDLNKPVYIISAVAILFIVVLGGYLIFTKSMEYSMAKEFCGSMAQAFTTTTTLPKL